MSADRVFVDTNVLAYLFDDAEPEKQEQARRCLETEHRTHELVISTQVLQELYVALTRGKQPIATADIAESAIRQAALGYTMVHINVDLVLAAIETSRTETISFWDALIVRAAAFAGCSRVLSEDMNAGQKIAGVLVENPFR
jgi:predicted nucleic acid-binding protein